MRLQRLDFLGCNELLSGWLYAGVVQECGCARPQLSGVMNVCRVGYVQVSDRKAAVLVPIFEVRLTRCGVCFSSGF
jgi:hypothetical protein